MKRYNSLIVGLAAVLGLASCNDYLDINNNPNTPTSSDASYEYRLPWCLHYAQAGYEIGASVDSYFTGLLTTTAAREGGASRWNLSASNRGGNIYQWFLVPCGSNLTDMYNSAMKAGAYHYAACARFMRAFGFMNFVDHFGEMPYTECFNADIITPKFDSGKTIFMGCIADIDEAIELFGRTQEASAQALSVGDNWNDGDVQKWIKLCYLLKARWLNHLSKKAAGSWQDGKYDADEILACLDKAQQSNADNTMIPHTDTNGTTQDVEGWSETVDYNTIFSCVGMNNNRYYVTKMFYDNLTNFAGNGIEDPRADKFIPWVRSKKGATTPADIKWSEDGKWRRSMGVDIVDEDIYSNGAGPYAATFTGNGETASGSKIDYSANEWYCNVANEARQGDTIYVHGKSSSKGYNKNKDLLYRYISTNDNSAFSGVYSVRPDSPTEFGTYWEACFIRAEVLMRKGDKAGAFAAYKKGIEANIKAVEDQCATWVSGDKTLADCPSFAPASQTAIDNFLANGIGTANDITMGKIMTQKIMTMLWSTENWNDMRRHDYDPSVFLGWGKPMWYETHGDAKTYCPEGSSPRRLPYPSIEIQYNSTNLDAIKSEVPNVDKLNVAEGTAWYNADAIRTLPVWWDVAE